MISNILFYVAAWAAWYSCDSVEAVPTRTVPLRIQSVPWIEDAQPVVTIIEVEMFSFAGQRIVLQNPSTNALLYGDLQDALDEAFNPCVSPTVTVWVYRVVTDLIPYWQAEFQTTYRVPQAITFYPQLDSCPNSLFPLATQNHNISIDGRHVFNTNKDGGGIQEQMTIDLGNSHPDYYFDIRNELDDVPIVIGEVEVFREDGTKIEIETFDASGYDGASNAFSISDGLYQTADSCNPQAASVLRTSRQANPNYWTGRIPFSTSYDRVSKIVIHLPVRACFGDTEQWAASQRFQIRLNEVLVFAVAANTQAQDTITLYFEPVEIFNIEFGKQIHIRRISPVIDASSNGPAVNPVFVFPSQSGVVGASIAAHAIDSRTQGKCGFTATCALTAPGRSANWFNAILISEERHIVTGFSILDNIDESESAAHVNGSYVRFRNQVQLLARNDPDKEFQVVAEEPECTCAEESTWFACPVRVVGDASKCNLVSTAAPSHDGGSSICRQGSVVQVLRDYELQITASIILIKSKIKNSLVYRTELLKLADVVLCIQQPFHSTRFGFVTSQFIEAAEILIQLLSQMSSTSNTIASVATDEPLLGVLGTLIRLQIMQKAYPLSEFKSSSQLPLYSLRRVIALPNTLHTWDFDSNLNRTMHLLELNEQLETFNDPVSYCKTLFQNLKQVARDQLDVATQNAYELAIWGESLNNRMTLAESDLETIVDGASKGAESLNVEIAATWSNFEESFQIDVQFGIFESVSMTIKQVGIVVIAASATVETCQAKVSHWLETGTFPTTTFEPVKNLLRKVTNLQKTLRGLSAEDKSSFQALKNAGYPIDVDQLAFEHERLNFNFESLAKELTQLANGIVAALKEPEKDPEKLSGGQIRETETNPTIWDSLFILMKSRFQYMNICVERSESRRLEEANTFMSAIFTTSSVTKGLLNERRNLVSRQHTNYFARSLAAKDDQDEKATQELVSRMQQQCGIFINQFRQLTTVGKKVHMELIELLYVIREYRNAQEEKRLYTFSLKHWDETLNTCEGSANFEFYRLTLRTQMSVTELMHQQELMLAKSKLRQICAAVDYLLNLEEPICSLSNSKSLDEIVVAYRFLKEKYEEKWVSRTNATSESYYALDVTQLVDLEQLQGISEVSDKHADFAFSLTPNDIPRSHILNCHSNVETLEVAIVFGSKGSSIVGESFATKVVVSGPFLKVQTPTFSDSQPGVSVFLPNNVYPMSFEYQSVERNHKCPSEQTEMMQLCDRKLCRISSGDNKDFANAKLALPSLYATYQVQVTKIGKSGLENLNTVHLVFKGRSTVNDISQCSNSVYEECGSDASGSGLIIAVAGGVALGSAVVVFLARRMKLFSSVSKDEQDTMVAEGLDEKVAIISPRFSL